MTRTSKRGGNSTRVEDTAIVFDFDSPSMLSYSTNDDGARIRQRRMAQNRASQRAFRERKRSHLEDVEAQLNKLRQAHDDLLETYKQKSDEVSDLMTYVGELKFEISTMQTSPNIFDMPENVDTEKAVKLEASPPHFNTQPGTAYTTQLNTPRDWDMRYSESDLVTAFNYNTSPNSIFYENSASGSDTIWS